MYFGVGIAFISGTIFAYRTWEDYESFVLVAILGAILILFGSLLRSIDLHNSI
ncbi:MAG: hypothetical protein Q8P81_01080 [Nanoarchaeota archaeon]|nr:hypothetical protein [Nanoarchaeota archaeon]